MGDPGRTYVTSEANSSKLRSKVLCFDVRMSLMASPTVIGPKEMTLQKLIVLGGPQRLNASKLARFVEGFKPIEKSQETRDM